MVIALIGISITFCDASSIGIGFSQTIDGEVAVGIQGEYETDVIDIDYDYQGISFHDARITGAYRLEAGSIDFTIFQENDFTGYELDNMNRTNDLGISAIIPITELEVEVAIFGRQGSTAAPVLKYDEDTGEVISEIPGLTPVDGVHPNISLATHLNFHDVDLELKMLSNIAEESTQQWLVDASTVGDVGPFQWVLSGLYRGQSYLDERQHEFSSMLTFGIDW